MKKVTKGVEWLFEKDQLESLLADFTEWNDDLERILPYVLSGMDVMSNKPLRSMLDRADKGSNFFGVHFDLQQQSRNLQKDPGGHFIEGKDPSTNGLLTGMLRHS